MRNITPGVAQSKAMVTGPVLVDRQNMKLPKRKHRVYRGKSKLTSPQTLMRLETRLQVADMRRQGYRVDEIATALGSSVQDVRACLEEVFTVAAEQLAETAEEARQLEIDRLDALHKSWYAISLDPKVDFVKRLQAGNMVITISARRAKLMALDKPEVKQLEITGVREYVGVDMSQV